MTTTPEPPIDLVYCWCDLADPVFRAEKEACARKLGMNLNEAANSDCRYVSNDELRYSLRSVAKFAPWINTVFLVLHDRNSPPAWLNVNAPRLRIVYHSDFMPQSCLPTFNSGSIEYGIARIPGLSEHFLFSNDDMFFSAHVSPDFFYGKDGYPIFRYMDSTIDVDSCSSSSYYLIRLANAYRFIRDNVGIRADLAKAFGRLPHHNVDAYLKSDILAFLDKFPDAVSKTMHQRFRHPAQLQRTAFSAYALAIGHGHFRRTKRPWYETMLGMPHRDSYYIPLERKSIERDMARIRPKLFCMNDNDKATDADRMAGRNFLEKMFPDPSSFEKADT